MEIIKAIIHRYNTVDDKLILSDQQLNLFNLPELESYLERLARQSFNSSKVREGNIEDEKIVNELSYEKLDFIEVSRKYSAIILDIVGRNNNLDFIFMILEEKEELYLYFRLVEGKSGFFLEKESGRSSYESHYIQGFWPDRQANLRHSFMINLDSFNLNVICPQKLTINYENAFSTDIYQTSTESLSIIEEEIKKEASEDPVKREIMLKTELRDLSIEYDSVSSLDLIHQVKGDLKASEEMMEERKLSEELDLKRIKKSQKLSRHRIRTSSGVEISIPLENLNYDDLIEINYNNEGEIESLVLKNLGRIV